MKRVTLELGSNSAVIIDETSDFQKMIPRLVTGAYSFQGQVCISIQRLYVQEKIYDEFVTAFVAETKKLIVGNPLDESTDISALIGSADVDRVQKWIESAVQQGGATLIHGGNVEDQVLAPTVLLHVPPTEKISCEEVFAPVVHINRFQTFEEAINCVNHSRYGLQAGVLTRDINRAFQAVRKLEVGGVMINDFPTFRVDHMPYGGVKQSGTGREGIKYAMEEMTELKFVSIKLD